MKHGYGRVMILEAADETILNVRVANAIPRALDALPSDWAVLHLHASAESENQRENGRGGEREQNQTGNIIRRGGWRPSEMGVRSRRERERATLFRTLDVSSSSQSSSRPVGIYAGDREDGEGAAFAYALSASAAAFLASSAIPMRFTVDRAIGFFSDPPAAEGGVAGERSSRQRLKRDFARGKPAPGRAYVMKPAPFLTATRMRRDKLSKKSNDSAGAGAGGANVLSSMRSIDIDIVGSGGFRSRSTIQSRYPTEFGSAVDCEEAVPRLTDWPPIRSPQRVHSIIASRVIGKRIVEIGTRNGDGMACFAQYASSATAIEIAVEYCRALESRAKSEGWGGGGVGGFKVQCADYKVASLDGMRRRSINAFIIHLCLYIF